MATSVSVYAWKLNSVARESQDLFVTPLGSRRLPDVSRSICSDSIVVRLPER